MKNVKAEGNYNEIFSNKISKETACMLDQIIESRKNKLGWAMVKTENHAYKAHVHQLLNWWSSCVLPIQMNLILYQLFLSIWILDSNK